MIIPPLSESMPSSSDKITNLVFIQPETPDAVPQTISELNAPFGSTGFPTDYTKTETLPYDGAFNIALSKPMTWLTDIVKSYVKSIISGEHTFAIFGVSGDPNKLVPYSVSTDKDWASFAKTVLNSRPSLVLHKLKDGKILFVYNYMYMPDASSKKQNEFLVDIWDPFYIFLLEQSPTGVESEEAWDVYTLQNAINTYNQGPAVICERNQCKFD